MDNESYNTCIDLVEWFESICQTVPNFELERDVFYLDGRIIQVASPAILRVNSLFIGSFGSSLFAIKRPVYPFLKISQMDANKHCILHGKLRKYRNECEFDVYFRDAGKGA